MPQLTFFYCTRYVVHSRMCVCFVSMFSSSQVNNGFGNGKWTCCMCVCVCVAPWAQNLILPIVVSFDTQNAKNLFDCSTPIEIDYTNTNLPPLNFFCKIQTKREFFFCNTYTRCKHTTTGVVFS